MKTKYLTLLSSAIALFTTAAFAEMDLPINLDFEQEGILKELQTNKDVSIYINPKIEAPGIGVVEDPDNPGNKVLEFRSNGTSQTNRLKIMLPIINKPFEYQFKCKVMGEIVSGDRSLLKLYAKDRWDKSVSVVIPYMADNKIYAVVDGKFKPMNKDLADWRTIRIAFDTNGQAPYTYSYSLFVDDDKLLSEVPMLGEFDEPLSVAEIALDFDSPDDVTKVKYLIDAIKIGSPTIDSPSAK